MLRASLTTVPCTGASRRSLARSLTRSPTVATEEQRGVLPWCVAVTPLCPEGPLADCVSFARKIGANPGRGPCSQHAGGRRPGPLRRVFRVHQRVRFREPNRALAPPPPKHGLCGTYGSQDWTWACALCGHGNALASHQVVGRADLAHTFVETTTALDRYGCLLSAEAFRPSPSGGAQKLFDARGCRAGARVSCRG